MRQIRLVTETFLDQPASNTAISAALLSLTAESKQPETLRLFVPSPVLAFGPQDLRCENFSKAVDYSFKHGFSPVKRLAGGRAAVFHRGTLGFSWTIPDDSPQQNVESRFKLVSKLILDSLKALGYSANVGEVPGEYCPGQYSINIEGRYKVMGVGQRIVRGAAHIGGVLVIDDQDSIRSVLVDVYRQLDIQWDPNTVGSLNQKILGEKRTTVEIVREAIISVFESEFDIRKDVLSKSVVELSRSLEKSHSIER